MDIEKLIYDVREGLNAISDDRFIDERLIVHTVDTVRATYLRKLYARSVGITSLTSEQSYPVSLETVDRSLIPGLPLNCNILRSVEVIPTLLYPRALGHWFSVSTADVIAANIDIINHTQAQFATFEFPVTKAFMHADDHLYLLQPDGGLDVQAVLVVGVFNVPLDVVPELTEYPLGHDDWAVIRQLVIDSLMNKPPKDVINNSEEDARARPNTE